MTALKSRGVDDTTVAHAEAVATALTKEVADKRGALQLQQTPRLGDSV